MIIDKLSRAERFFKIHLGFQAAFSFLRAGKFIPGRHAIDQTSLIAIYEEAEALGKERSPLEIHRKYIDIQYIIGGKEAIGWKPLENCEKVSHPYDDEKDIGYFADEPLLWVPVSAGSLAIFFPEDAHAPLAGDGQIRRVIIKVPV